MRDRLRQLSPPRRRLVIALSGAVALLVLVGAGIGVARSLGGTDGVDQADPGPVVVVPGYGGKVSSLAPLVAALRSEGRTVIAFQPTQGGQGDLRVQARRLASLVTTTMKRDDAGSVDVVGYSAGGVIARLYVRDDGGASVVRRVLTLGSPHHGTDVAALAEDVAGGCPTACEQLATGSDLLRRLNAGDETPAGPRWITVRTDADRTVTPSGSAALSGALNLRVQDRCPEATTTHDELPGDSVVLATLPTVLGAGPPRAPGKVSC